MVFAEQVCPRTLLTTLVSNQFPGRTEIPASPLALKIILKRWDFTRIGLTTGWGAAERRRRLNRPSDMTSGISLFDSIAMFNASANDWPSFGSSTWLIKDEECVIGPNDVPQGVLIEVWPCFSSTTKWTEPCGLPFVLATKFASVCLVSIHG